ncbi:pyruvate kinase [Blastopirellula marina]|uniref:pyruvate kinase n=1 Tax=Blastopirellula marina TaxID=124 RepID=A0A2S8FX50_9BACT|nr:MULTISPECIES: pyruvate kinase [Pirellulaceae]PQO36748.1 pyruvate kinase [Blastopirellula marina]RCS53463.1 pyruvate kinase [Bremerella cremea]
MDHSSAQLFDTLIDSLLQLREGALKLEEHFSASLAKIPDSQRQCGRNLVHYLSVRQHDIRELQYQLHALGLSSLGRMEAYVLPTIDAVLTALHRLADRQPPAIDLQNSSEGFRAGRAHLDQNTNTLFGEPGSSRQQRIMVTIPSEGAQKYELILELLQAGMDVMRINCSKDDQTIWAQMIDHLRRAEQETGRKCKVQMDLAGPNPRTGRLESRPGVLHWRPRLKSNGKIRSNAQVWISSLDAKHNSADEVLPIPEDALRNIQQHDILLVTDTRGRQQSLLVTSVEESGCWAEGADEVFVEPNAHFCVLRNNEQVLEGHIANSFAKQTEHEYTVRIGDLITLTHGNIPGHPPRKNADGEVLEPASIGCNLPEIYQDVRPGDRFFYDDGEMGAVVREASAERVVIEVTQTRKDAVKIRSDKGINFPDTHFNLPALTQKDRADLDFVVSHADILAYSFVRHVHDVEDLIDELNARDADTLGIILKIETQQAFANLPELLLAALRHPPIGVMVARGDMGVEIGFNRMSEVQEEILWLSEAAHVPVIWATQVLESLAKKGLPTRAEVTDAAMSGRAECVMLNKGEHIVETVRFLSEILERMQAHQHKKLATLRKLSLSNICSAS